MKTKVPQRDDDVMETFSVDSAFAAYVFTPSLYREMSLILFRHTLGATAAAQFDLQFGELLENLLQGLTETFVVIDSNPAGAGGNQHGGIVG